MVDILYICYMVNVICPIGKDWVNGNQIRINAAIVFITVFISLWFNNPILIIFLCIDFFIRGFTKYPLSILNLISSYLINTLGIGYAKENKAPKKFAAKIGFGLILLSCIFYFTPLTYLFSGILMVIILFSFLEFAFKFCAGCYLYTFLVKLGVL